MSEYDKEYEDMYGEADYEPSSRYDLYIDVFT
jgi:hypothetical protein